MENHYVPESLAIPVEKLARKLEKKLGTRVVDLFVPCERIRDPKKTLYRFESKREEKNYQNRLEEAIGDYPIELIDKEEERTYVQVFPPPYVGRIINIRKKKDFRKKLI